MNVAEVKRSRYPGGPSLLDRPADKGLLKEMTARIEVMSTGDIDAVAALHIKGIPRGVLTELGPDFLKLFYGEIIAGPYGTGFVIRKDDGLAGFIAGSNNPALFFKRLFRRRFLKIGWIVIKKFLVYPPFLLKLIRRGLINLDKANYAESLAGAVSKEYQSRGYGIVLLKKLIDEFRRQGADRVQCDVIEDDSDPDLTRLLRMYQKGGYVENGGFNLQGVTYKRYLRYLT